MNDPKEPVVIHTAADLMEAAQLKSELEAAGFLCSLLNAQHTSMLPGSGFAIGIRIMVPAGQAKKALQFIEDRGNTKVVKKALAAKNKKRKKK
jgi:hypothetical protein